VALTAYAGNYATQRTAAKTQFNWGADGSSRRFQYSLEAWRKTAPDLESVVYMAGFDGDHKPVWKQTEQRSANLTQLMNDFGQTTDDMPLGHYSLHVIGLDEQGKPGYQQEHTLLLTAGDQPPTVTIVSPNEPNAFVLKSPVRLEATAADPEDGDVSYKIAWSSSKDGGLGTGSIVSKVLSPGLHTLTASVTDSNGVTATARVDLTVRS
jgi:hypothetical protein